MKHASTSSRQSTQSLPSQQRPRTSAPSKPREKRTPAPSKPREKRTSAPFKPRKKRTSAPFKPRGKRTSAVSNARVNALTLLNFQRLIASSDLDAVMNAYLYLAKENALKRSDSSHIAALLHNAGRSRLGVLVNRVKEHAGRIVEDYRLGILPPHPRASLHLISYFKESGQHDKGVEFWTWVIGQDDAYSGLSTYGAAIELLAAYGKSLEYCEEVYMHALKRFPNSFNEYHLSAGAILPDRGAFTTMKGSSMNLLQGIMKARLVHGDWRNAYLALDTSLRLHPTQLPPHVFDMFLHERPIHEAFQVCCMMCQSGSVPSSASFAILLDCLKSIPAYRKGHTYNHDLVKAMVTVFHYYIGAGGTVDAIHLNILLQGTLGLLRWIPSSLEEYPEAKDGTHIESTVADLLSQLFNLFTRLGLTPAINTFNNIISISGKLHFRWLTTLAMEMIEAVGLSPDLVTYRTLLIAAGESRDAGATESIWGTLKDYVGKEGSTLGSQDWKLLVRATKNAGNVVFLNKQMILHQCQLDSNLMREINAQLSNGEPRDFREGNERHIPRRINFVADICAELKQLDELIANGLIGNLFTTSPSQVSIWPWPQPAEQEKQREFYDDLTLDPALRKTFPVDTTDAYAAPSAMVNQTPTGIPLDEIRFRNWKIINDLLMQAELFEARVERSVDEAVEQGKPMKRARSLKDASVGMDERKLAITQLSDHVLDIRIARRRKMTEEEWRAKILELRRHDP
ncbi:hypothetical protein MMC24_003457 [Lignoscripta atroalba]|nr:hypothetical protein [Lignoscripta atroalba]